MFSFSWGGSDFSEPWWYQYFEMPPSRGGYFVFKLSGKAYQMFPGVHKVSEFPILFINKLGMRLAQLALGLYAATHFVFIIMVIYFLMTCTKLDIPIVESIAASEVHVIEKIIGESPSSQRVCFAQPIPTRRPTATSIIAPTAVSTAAPARTATPAVAWGNDDLIDRPHAVRPTANPATTQPTSQQPQARMPRTAGGEALNGRNLVLGLLAGLSAIALGWEVRQSAKNH